MFQYALADRIRIIEAYFRNDEGILIDFTPIEDEPILNAIQLKKLDW